MKQEPHQYLFALPVSSSHFLSAMGTERNAFLFGEEMWRDYHVLVDSHSLQLILLSLQASCQALVEKNLKVICRNQTPISLHVFIIELYASHSWS